MAVQTATTGNLENAQRAVIANARYTMEHSMPVANLYEHAFLKKGEKSLYVPKLGQWTASDLVDGQDIIDEQAIALSGVTLTTGEVGLKVILTDKLVRQENEDVFKWCGQMAGDAMARKKDEDCIALFSGFAGGVALGADNKYLTLQNAMACAAAAKSRKFPKPVYFVHHPNAVFALASSLANAAGTLAHGPDQENAALRNFYKFTLNGMDFYEDGNIDKLAGYDSGYGAIFSRAAACVLEQMGFTTERERDASLRATELVVTADYGCWEIDNDYGAPAQYEIGEPSTSN